MHGKNIQLIAGRVVCLTILAVLAQVTANSQSPSPSAAADSEYQTSAVLWQQSAAEARALRYQAYALARLSLDRDLRTRQRVARKRAVVVDIDETVLDNSGYQAGLVINHQAFDDATFTAWCNRAEALAIPGAVEFLKYASSRGVTVFYVTNRHETEKAATIANLKQVGFPGVSDETVMVRTGPSSKEPRRQEISKRYRIVLLIGDNLADLSVVFEGKTPEERAAAVDAARNKFGAEFIMLPNPMYGDWESAIYGYDFKLSEAQKAERRKAALKAFPSR